MAKPMTTARLHGLDIARFVAFIGMVLVNFSTVIGVEGGIAEPVSGKAAATFVFLAGVGLGLASASRELILRRAAFLFVIGILNALIFQPDIIHYYAVYFACAALFIGASARILIWAGLSVGMIGALTVILGNYDAGWNWETLTYEGFWTPSGFLRNLFLNGWHPVFPWLSFLFFGMAASRWDLSSLRVQNRLIGLGFCLLLGAELGALSLITLANDPELAQILTTSPIPPMPLFVAAGTGAALLTTGACLRFGTGLGLFGTWLAAPGRMTLTLYIAHIIIGMGLMEAFGLIDTGAADLALSFTLVFCCFAFVFGNIWVRFFQRGPLEAVMRRVTNTGKTPN